jgi:hypothetical protein
MQMLLVAPRYRKRLILRAFASDPFLRAREWGYCRCAVATLGSSRQMKTGIGT